MKHSERCIDLRKGGGSGHPSSRSKRSVKPYLRHLTVALCASSVALNMQKWKCVGASPKIRQLNYRCTFCPKKKTACLDHSDSFAIAHQLSFSYPDSKMFPPAC
jgi:hypothetical protein